MADSLKRPPAETDYASASDDTDLKAQLRSTAARVRKSVTEGYITPPSSRAFTKAQSTTTIFSSARDINRDLFGPSSLTPARSAVHDTNKKRSRSADRGSDAESDIVLADNQPSNEYSSQSLSSSRANRATKPLRKHRGMRDTQSLPAGAFHFSHQSLDTETTMAPPDEADEDWSIQASYNSNHIAFEPAVFD